MVDFHFVVSMIKSALRLGACGFLYTGSYVGAAGMFAVAEVLGIIEEL